MGEQTGRRRGEEGSERQGASRGCAVPNSRRSNFCLALARSLDRTETRGAQHCDGRLRVPPRGRMRGGREKGRVRDLERCPRGFARGRRGRREESGDSASAISARLAARNIATGVRWRKLNGYRATAGCRGKAAPRALHGAVQPDAL